MLFRVHGVGCLGCRVCRGVLFGVFRVLWRRVSRLKVDLRLFSKEG